MSKTIYNNQVYSGGAQIQFAVVHLVAATPASARVGQLYFKTGVSGLYMMTANGERPCDAGLLTDGSIQPTAFQVSPYARANHTGTQLAASISDFNTAVQGNSISSLAAAIATINAGSQRLTNLAQATNASDAVPLSQVQYIAQQAAEGQNKIKDPARVYAASNITLSGLQTIDGIALGTGDRVLVANQTTSTQNNIYIANANSWTIPSDCNDGGEWSAGSDVLITEGNTYAGSIFRQQTTGTITIGTSALSFTQASKINVVRPDGVSIVQTGNIFSVPPGLGLTTSSGHLGIDTTTVARVYSTVITGDGSTPSWTINHNLGKTNVVVQIIDSSGVTDDADVNRTSANSVTVATYSPLASGVALTIVIIG